MNFQSASAQYFYPFYYYQNEQNAAGDQPLSSTLKRRLMQGLFDFIGILLVFAIFAIILFTVEPRIRFMTCDMSDVSYPKSDDTVAFWVVGIYGFLVPIAAIIIVELFNSHYNGGNDTKRGNSNKWRRFGITVFHGLSLFLFGCGIVLLLAEIGKRSVGRLRPHFLAVCDPDYTQIDCNQAAMTGNLFKSFTTGGSFCRGNADDIKEARLSFPSGHASFSTYTMLFLIVYLEARVIALYLRYPKVLVQMGAFIIAFYTVLSRVPDYAHRGSDVIGGAVLGSGVALVMTLLVGRVLWVYEGRRDDVEVDFRRDRKNETS